MVTLDSRGICALTLSFIAVADISIIFNIPGLSQVLGFVLLTFLPGFLLIEILRPTKDPLEKTLFAIGLSISFLMFVALAMNFVYPPLGISRPISLLPLLLTFSVALAALSLLAYRTGALDMQITLSPFNTLVDRIRSPPALAAGLILVFGILGPLFMRFDFNTIFLLLLMLSIAAIVVLIISGRVSERFYPLYILAIAIALQYSHTLASPNLFGSDVQVELYFANIVRSAGVWNPGYSLLPSFFGDYVAMLSVTMLPNVYSILLNADTVLVYQVVWPIIFAFVPLGLYQIYKTQTKLGNRSAFLAAFFFMSYFVFYTYLPAVTRQEIAVLFFVLVALLILNNNLPRSKRSTLIILFISSMVVSHYATSYFFLFYLAFLVIGSALIRSKNRHGKSQPLSATIVVLAVVITFGWNIIASGGAPYIALIETGNHVASSLSTQFSTPLDQQTAAATSLNVAGVSFTQQLSHYWQLLTEVLIIIGLAVVTWQRRKTSKMSSHLLLLSLASFVILLIVIGLPAINESYNTVRAYMIALLFLAPCCVFGAEAIADFTSSRLHLKADTALKLTCAALIVVFLPFFLFSTGTISEIVEHPSNYALLSPANHSDPHTFYLINPPWSYLIIMIATPTQGVHGSTWLGGAMDRSLVVHSDANSVAELVGYGDISPTSLTWFAPWNLDQPINHAYVYLGYYNVLYNNLSIGTSTGANEHVPIASVHALTTGTANRIYSNGLVEVYYCP
jgi:uncharacterized membrane protein